MKDPTPRELSTLLAALRMWQNRNLPTTVLVRAAEMEQASAMVELEVIAKSHGPALDTEEIDQLAAKLQSQMPK